MDKINFFKELYFAEFERKERIENQLSIALTAIIGLVLSVLYIIDYFIQHEDIDHIKLLVLISSFITIFMLGVSVAFFIRGFYGSDYKYTPYSDMIKKHREELEDYFMTYKLANTKGKVDEFIVETFSSCSGYNARENDRKSKLFYRGRAWLAWAFFPFMILVILFGYHLATRLGFLNL